MFLVILDRFPVILKIESSDCHINEASWVEGVHNLMAIQKMGNWTLG